MIQQDGGAWTVYGQTMADLDSEMKTYSFDATLNTPDIPKLIFFLGNTENAEPKPYISIMSFWKE